MSKPLLKQRLNSESDPAATELMSGWRNLDWERLSHDDAAVNALVETARAAGEIALKSFKPGEKTIAKIDKKPGGSPVTEADYAVNRYLEDRLGRILPDAGWLSEESADTPERLDQELIFIVDPIDGTRGFAAGERIWAVSIAVIYRHRPVIGVVHAPAMGETYVAVKNGGARLNGREIKVSDRARLDASALVGGPLSLAQGLRGAGLHFDLLPKISALAVRICKVASGALDAALISADARDWDIAASDLIVAEAGGRLTSFYGRELLYNRNGTTHGQLIAAPLPILAQITAAAVHANAP